MKPLEISSPKLAKVSARNCKLVSSIDPFNSSSPTAIQQMSGKVVSGRNYTIKLKQGKIEVVLKKMLGLL